MRTLIILITTLVIYLIMSSRENNKEEIEQDEFLKKLNIVIEKIGILVYASGTGILASLLITRDTSKITTWFALPVTLWILDSMLSIIYDKEKESEKNKMQRTTEVIPNNKAKEILKSKEWKKAMREEMYKPKGGKNGIRKGKY